MNKINKIDNNEDDINDFTMTETKLDLYSYIKKNKKYFKYLEIDNDQENN